MNEDFYSYIRKLHLFIEGQDKRILRLEEELQNCLAEIKALKEKPSINVEKIEYKFDQLKVESLEGTLNIGLNPADLQGIDEFSVENQLINTGMSPEDRMRGIVEIEDTLTDFIEKETGNLVAACEQSLQKTFDPSYISFIKNDVKKQLPNRIEYFMDQIHLNPRSSNPINDHKIHVIEKLKQEIEKGIHAFLNSLPDKKKGMN